MRPCFERLLKVLWGEEPDRVPFYEHFVDNEVIEAMTGEPATKLVPINPRTARSLEVKADKLNLRKKRYARILVRFYRGLGYDYVPMELPLNLARTNIRETKDTASLSRGVRTWVDEGKGTIEKWEDFERYLWPEPEVAADYDQLEKLCRILPRGMGVV